MNLTWLLFFLMGSAMADAKDPPLAPDGVPLTASMEDVLVDAHSMELFRVTRDFEAGRPISGPKLMSRRASPLANAHDDDELRAAVLMFVRPSSYVRGGGPCLYSPALGFRFRDDHHYVDLSVCLECGNVAAVMDDEDPLRGEDPEQILYSNMKPRLEQLRRLFEPYADLFEWSRE